MAKTLKPTATIAAEAAIAAQAAARQANSVTLTNAVRDIIGAYVNAETATATAKTAWETAQENQRTKLEDTYVALAALSHANEMNVEMIRDTLHAALVHFYGEEKAKSGVGTVAKLRAQLSRAMQPKVRAKLPEIIQPWAEAWEAETQAIAAERAAAEAEGRPVKPVSTPIRDKFDNRGNTVTQAIQLALGASAKLNGKGDKVISPAVPSVVATKADDVLTWVSAHPRVKRSPAPSNGSGEAITGTPREIARARVEAIVAAVKALAADYPAALDTIQPVLDALVHVTGDRLVPAKPAPSAADKPLKAPKPSEPVEGAAQLDDAIDPKLLAQFAAFMKLANGK